MPKDDRKRLEVLKETEIDAAVARQKLQEAIDKQDKQTSNGDSTPRGPGDPGEWTVLVYMVAYGALRPFAERDLFEMSMAEGSPHVHVHACVHWQEGQAPASYDITHGRGNEFGFSRTSADPRSVADRFKTFVTTRVPVHPGAQSDPHRCLMILWGHAIDGQFGGLDNHGMSLQQIRQGIEAGRGLNRRLEVLGFDACDMSRLETLTQLTGLATVLIGSQIGVPFSGFPYHTILARLGQDPGMPEAKLSRLILDEYYHSYEPPRVTLTMLNNAETAAYETLNASVKALATEVKDVLSAEIADIVRDTLLETENLGPDPLVDLKDFCLTFRSKLDQSLSVGPTVKTRVRQAIDLVLANHKAIVAYHQRRGPFVSRLNGIGFSPGTFTSGWDKYLDVYDRLGWRRPAPTAAF